MHICPCLVHKITNVPGVYMWLVLSGFEGGLSITQGILGGGGPKNLVNGTRYPRAISGPKKVSIFRAPPPKLLLVMDNPLKTTSYRPI